MQSLRCAIALGIAFLALSASVVAQENPSNAPVTKKKYGQLLKEEFERISRSLQNDPTDPWHQVPKQTGKQGSAGAAGSSTNTAVAQPSPSGSPVTHDHYNAQLGIFCPLQREMWVTVYLPDPKTRLPVRTNVNCEDARLALSDLNINVYRGPFCACLESPDNYCARKQQEILNMTNETLRHLYPGTGPCYRCSDPFCYITIVKADGPCVQSYR